LQNHPDMRSSSKEALAKLLLPSGAAIVTDAAGFTVLVLVGIPAIQALALICTLWLLTIFPGLLLAAALVAVMPKPKPGSYRLGLNSVERLWRALNLQRNGVLVISLTLCAFVAGIYGAGRLTIGDEVGSSILWPESRFNSDAEYLNESFTLLGTDLLQVYIEGEENTMVNPSVYHAIEALDRHMYQYLPEARPAQSLVPIVKSINSVLYEGDPSYGVVPDTLQELAFNTYLFRSKGEPGDFAAYTDPEWRIGNLSIPIINHAAETVERTIDVLENFIADGGTDNVESANFLFAGGQIGITKAVNDEIREANSKLLVAILLVIAVCVFLYYRSPLVSLLLVFSLATSNFVTYAFMAASGIGLNLNTLVLSALGIGLGVDYGIYMLDRIREETRAGYTPFDAVARAISTAGNAIFITAFAMIIPMLPWLMLSSLRFQAEMGMLLGMVLFLNMIGALVFLPSAVLIFKPKALVSEPEPLTVKTHS
jgi:predicted RND superfamily exporter protein